ncbi:hypothetical protein [Kitasatospora camelliae]|uniref:Circularly permuted ATP-grasp superfamily protein n=1 Tax=Kitasatospora camelliae TaxID=3156397 RepID=A0AAU8K724_9ACTN
MNTITEDFLRLPLRRAGTPRRDRPVARARRAAPRLTRPVFLDAGQVERLHRDIAALYDLLMALPERLTGGDLTRYGALLGLTGPQIEAARRTARPGTPRLARPDVYWTEDGFRVLEMNATSALGGVGISWQARLHLADPAVRAFVDARGLRCLDTMSLLADEVRACCERRGHAGTLPVVAVVDSPAGYDADPASSEFVAMMYAERGFTARAADAGRLRRRDGGLWLDGLRVDVVHRMFLLEELVSESDAAAFEEVFRAQEADEVLMMLPLDVEALCGKSALAVLSDQRHRAVLSEEERALVDRVLPWTGSMDAGKLLVDGEEVDPLDHCLAHREDLVLKPSWMHGGIGVLPGWTVPEREWRERVTAALGGPYVVQRRVVPAPELFRSEETGALEPWVLNWGVFLVGDAFGGVQVRGLRADAPGAVVSQGDGASLSCCFSA